MPARPGCQGRVARETGPRANTRSVGGGLGPRDATMNGVTEVWQPGDASSPSMCAMGTGELDYLRAENRALKRALREGWNWSMYCWALSHPDEVAVDGDDFRGLRLDPDQTIVWDA